MRLFAPLYDRVMSWSRHRHAHRYLAAMSFAESSFFPVPPDVLLAPMTLARPDHGWRLALLTTIASVVGGLAGYAIGWFSLDAVEPVLRSAGYWEDYLRATAWFGQWGFWAVLLAGFSPIPYKVFTIAAGVFELPLAPFFAASAVGRAGRFFLVAGLIYKFGPKIQEFIERHLGWLSIVFAALLLGGFVFIKYVIN